MTDLEEVTCECCGKEFISVNSREEAMKDCNELWGNLPEEEIAVICDACFERMSPAKYPELYLASLKYLEETYPESKRN